MLILACSGPSQDDEQDSSEIGSDAECRPYALDGGGYSADAPSDCFSEEPAPGSVYEPDAGPCGPLLELYCGKNKECDESPSCVAVKLMQEAPDSGGICESRTADAGQFVVCIDIHLCEALVQKTCGAPPAALSEDSVCVQRPACQQALASYQQLHDADGGGYSIAEFCGQALQEPSAFPACNEE